MNNNETILRLVTSAKAVLECPELQTDVSASTLEKIETLLDDLAHIRRELELPSAEEILKYFGEKYRAEDQDILFQRLMALVGTLPKKTLYAAYELEVEKE